MPNFWTRLTGGRSALPDEQKSAPLQALISMTGPGAASWTGRGYHSLASEGVMKNPVVYRCVRLIAEAATRVPLGVSENGQRLSDHPALSLLQAPNPRQSGPELFEELYAYLQTSGNAYLKAGLFEGELRTLHILRPDRMQVVTGRDGWPTAYSYTAGGSQTRFALDTDPVAEVLHVTLFHPLSDHYGLAPLEAALTSLDTHNAAARWNKALLDNAARPSGALIYSNPQANLTTEQFERLKAELEVGFQGAVNAGRPMVLEGGLDWKAMALTPKDMDFLEAKNAAAREIALAFGVPPMLLGIPGDNTYANYAEANRALWRHTIVPLVRRVAATLTRYLQPAFGGAFVLDPDFDGVEALSEDRSALWKRVGEADFLSDEEKRRLVGLGGA